MIGQESAETVALQALAWLAGNEELLPVFLGSTGASLADMARGAQDSVFLCGVLDFLLMDDAWVLSCCKDIGVAGDQLLAARASLGGDQVHWT